MKIKPIIRTTIIIAAVVIIGVVGYKVFFNKSSAPASALQTTAGVGAGQPTPPSNTVSSTSSTAFVGQDFLTLLLNVQSIKLDDSIFSNKEFTLLQDFNRPIPPDTNPGRPNPFAPLGIDGGAGTASSQITTSNPSSVTATTSTLNGALLVAMPGVTRWFEYGATANLGAMTTPKAQSTQGAFAEIISGLLPNTTYYVKAVASINGTIVSGNVLSWKTAQASR